MSQPSENGSFRYITPHFCIVFQLIHKPWPCPLSRAGFCYEPVHRCCLCKNTSIMLEILLKVVFMVNLCLHGWHDGQHGWFLVDTWLILHNAQESSIPWEPSLCKHTGVPISTILLRAEVEQIPWVATVTAVLLFEEAIWCWFSWGCFLSKWLGWGYEGLHGRSSGKDQLHFMTTVITSSVKPWSESPDVRVKSSKQN